MDELILANAKVTIVYSDFGFVQGPANLQFCLAGVDPLLSATADNSGQYQLRIGSPALNSGNKRFGPKTNMGAYQGPGV